MKRRPPDDIHDFNIDKPNRELYLTTEENQIEIEHSMATRFIKNLRILTLDNTDPILIHMKSPGGDVAYGFAIYDAIKTCPCYVTIYAYAHAASMSSIILQAADRRVMMPSAYFMLHRGSIWAGGEANAVKSFVEFNKHYDKLALDIYAERVKEKHPKKSLKRIREQLNSMMDRQTDVFMTAREAVEWGLADEVYDGGEG